MISAIRIRVLVVAIWVILTASISWFVARNVDSSSDGLDYVVSAPTIDSSSVATVTLSEQLVAPVISADGRVTQVNGTFLIEAPISDDDLAYRLLDPPLGVKALIAGGPAGFDCPWFGLGQGVDGAVTMRCSVPASVRVASGLDATMVIQVGKPVTAQVLPISAVVGSADQGMVVVLDRDGSRTVKQVTLGASDAINIQISGGLDPTDRVIQYPTQRDFDLAT